MCHWLQATYPLTASKKGSSAHQFHCTLGVTYKTVWFMFHRLREAMRAERLPMMGTKDKVVEADGALSDKKHVKPKGAGGYAHKEAVLSLIERGGRMRSRDVQTANAETLKPIIEEQVASDTTLMADEAGQHRPVGRDFAGHETARHSIGEYVRGEAHTNTIKGYSSIFKRGMKGVHQHCSSRHLKRYPSEFDFRYNERQVCDRARMTTALIGIVGMRLLYGTDCFPGAVGGAQRR